MLIDDKRRTRTVLETTQDFLNMSQAVSRISIRGYKSIRELNNLELGALNVLVGTNGSGKSNFISFFSILRHMIEGRLQPYITQGGQASSFLYQGPKKTKSISADLTFGNDGYLFALEPTVKGELMFTKEHILVSSGDTPIHLASVTGNLESCLPHSTLDSEFKEIQDHMMRAISSWKVYHFHDTSPNAPVKQRGEIQDNEILRSDAANIAPFLYRLKQTHPAHYEAIRDAIRSIAPFFHDFRLLPNSINSNVINLEWTQVNSDFPFRVDQLSDGTLRFICLATLLLQPTLPATIIIDEPEIGLHPFAISYLSGLLKKASSRTQVIIATQSVTLIDTFDLENLIVVERQDGESLFKRPDVEKLKVWLNDYSLGELWEKSVLGGG